MATTDPILTALARMEERFVERMTEWSCELRRDLQLAMDGGFHAVHKRLDRLEQEYEMVKAGIPRGDLPGGATNPQGLLSGIQQFCGRLHVPSPSWDPNTAIPGEPRQRSGGRSGHVPTGRPPPP